MVGAFGYRLQQSLASLVLSPTILRDLQANLINLGGLEVPSTLDAKTAAMIRGTIVQAFVFGFRLIMLLCAGLAVASAAVAAWMIPSREIRLPANLGTTARHQRLVPAPGGHGRNEARELSNWLAPFHRICTPIHTSRNADSLMITFMPVGPIVAPNRFAKP